MASIAESVSTADADAMRELMKAVTAGIKKVAETEEWDGKDNFIRALDSNLKSMQYTAPEALNSLWYRLRSTCIWYLENCTCDFQFGSCGGKCQCTDELKQKIHDIITTRPVMPVDLSI